MKPLFYIPKKGKNYYTATAPPLGGWGVGSPLGCGGGYLVPTFNGMSLFNISSLLAISQAV